MKLIHMMALGILVGSASVATHLGSASRGGRSVEATAIPLRVAEAETTVTDSLGVVVVGELGRRMDRVVSAAEVLGFSGQVLVVVRGRPVLHRAYGFADPAARRAMQLNTPVGIASITKQFAAAAILEMETRGRLSLDDPLPRFFDAVPEDKRAVTLRQLVTHRSGLRTRFREDFEPATRKALIRGILETPLAFPPGERWQYSAAGYNLLAAVVEEVTGRPYEEAIRALFVEPAGMRSTGFLSALPETGPAVAAAYLGWDDRGSPDRWPRNWRNFGAGDMVSTAEDLYRWETALREGRVLASAGARERFFTPLEPIGDETSYGFGLFFHRAPSGPLLVEHGGDAALGFNGSFYRYVEEDFLVIITCTARTPEGQYLRHAIGEELEALARGAEVELSETARLPTPAEIDRLAGSYRTETGERFHVLTDGAHLWLAGGDPGASAFLLADRAGDPADLAVAVEKTETLLGGLLRGDSTAYLTALTDDGAVHFPDYWREWGGLVESRGPFFDFHVVGARSLGPDILTNARLRFFQGSVNVTYFWLERAHGRLGGTFVGESSFRPTAAVALTPIVGEAEHEREFLLAGRHPLRGTTVVEVRARPGSEGIPASLVLRTGGREVVATKTGVAGWVPPLR